MAPGGGRPGPERSARAGGGLSLGLARAGYGLAAALALAGLAFVWGFEPAYLALTYDDSFYYLQIARNVARGLGPSFDGVEPTNGFHPLWLALFAALARAAPSADAAGLMRAALTAQLGLVALGTVALARAGLARPGAVALAAALVFAHSDALKIAVNGQESALLYAALAALVAFGSGERAWSSAPRAALAGLLMGLALLARTDALLAFAAWAALALAWRGAGVPAAERARRVALASALALAPLGLYALFNAARFGHAAQISAAIKYEGLFYPPYARRWAPPLLAAAALALFARALRRRAAGDGARAEAYRALFVLVAYATSQWALTWGARGVLAPDPWYLVPALEALVVALSLALDRPGGPGRASAPLAALSLALALAGWARRLDPGAYALGDAYRRAAAWLRASPFGAERAAGWDCGLVGAHFDGRLSNLDGLAASWRYKERYLEPGRVGAFLDEAGVTSIVQHFARDDLDPPGSFVGVDLGAFRVAHAECVTLRLATRPWQRTHRFVAVLSRHARAEGPRFDDAARAWRALEGCPLPREGAPAQANPP
ncbi:MAG TPA: hypothetical protein VFS43_08295 [Polyangiaceae bacterium]|nr:hypothetical protein [Polyangiaceae bacterium]